MPEADSRTRARTCPPFVPGARLMEFQVQRSRHVDFCPEGYSVRRTHATPHTGLRLQVPMMYVPVAQVSDAMNARNTGCCRSPGWSARGLDSENTGGHRCG